MRAFVTGASGFWSTEWGQAHFVGTKVTGFRT
jgi:hypothetical protein